MKKLIFRTLLLTFITVFGCQKPIKTLDDFQNYSQSRKTDLQLSVYITAHTVQQVFTTEAGKREALSVLNCNGISKVYVEVYRTGMLVSPEVLKSTVAFLKENGFEVIGGIATLPGEGTGVAQEGPLTWFNWQNPKPARNRKQRKATKAGLNTGARC